MEHKLKVISSAGIPQAIAKAERYRFLNEPGESESICRDILAAEPEHQLAIRVLGLTITDQFTGGAADRYAEVEKLFQSLTDPYERFYYTGVLHERRAKAQLAAGRPPHSLLVLFEAALKCFEQAEQIRPAGDDDPILRWNRCVRLIEECSAAEPQREIKTLGVQDSPPL